MGYKVGYARVSSSGQSLDVQLKALEDAGCDPKRIYQEKVSGVTAERAQLKALQAFVREGDTVIITKIDRLGRSLNDLSSIVADFEEKGVLFEVLDQSINTATSEGKLLLGILSSVAEWETSIRKERQTAGIAMARANGQTFGRTPKVKTEQVLAAYQEHGSLGKAAAALDVTKTTIHRHLAKAKKAKAVAA